MALFALSKALPQSAEERLSKLEADAKRYRWLSGNGWADPAFYATGPREWGANGVALLAGPQLDAAIDAAMADAGMPWPKINDDVWMQRIVDIADERVADARRGWRRQAWAGWAVLAGLLAGVLAMGTFVVAAGAR